MLALPPPPEEPLFIEWFPHGSRDLGDKVIARCDLCDDWWLSWQLGPYKHHHRICEPCLDKLMANWQANKETYFRDLFAGAPTSTYWSYGAVNNPLNITITTNTGSWTWGR